MGWGGDSPVGVPLITTNDISAQIFFGILYHELAEFKILTTIYTITSVHYNVNNQLFLTERFQNNYSGIRISRTWSTVKRSYCHYTIGSFTPVRISPVTTAQGNCIPSNVFYSTSRTSEISISPFKIRTKSRV